jgi:hypothetical protein
LIFAPYFYFFVPNKKKWFDLFLIFGLKISAIVVWSPATGQRHVQPEDATSRSGQRGIAFFIL